ncbi:MAG TPA: hypothetical protein VGO68_05255 [Pyrinomonadaceae bacterium]|jgi:hypothetical protein|nr:hypothetical protein [Pyrinomonadaceae bacterium]
MWSIINNPWIVGIVGSVVSGLAVFLITGVIIAKREGKEIRQRIQTANSEVLNSLRLLIPEKVPPPHGLIDSMLRSSAKKHAVKKEDLPSAEVLAEDIIIEIMSNPFLSPKHKVEYCEFALRIARDDHREAAAAGRGRPDLAEKCGFKEKGRSDISIVLGVATFSSVLLGILSTSLGTGTLAFNKEAVKSNLSFIAVAIIIPTLCLWCIDFYRDIRELRKVRVEARRVAAGTDQAGNSGESETE